MRRIPCADVSGFKKRLALVLAAAVLFSCGGCGMQTGGNPAKTTASPAPVQPNASDAEHDAELALEAADIGLRDDTPKANVFTQVTTADRLTSIVLEGFTDQSTMEQISVLMKASGYPNVFFISGATAMDYPQTVRYIMENGSGIGNYGITGKKEMETATAEKNYYQFSRGQTMITEACGQTPTMFRCNSSEYSDKLLQVATLCGLTDAVQPSVFLNHRSFKSADEALNFVQKLPRGSIISIKLGQELDLKEYGFSGRKLDERPAVDPSPNISTERIETEQSAYQNIVNVVKWLLAAIRMEQYSVITLDELAKRNEPIFANPLTLTQEQEALLNPQSYELPITGEPLGVPKTEPVSGAYYDDVLFIGDSITMSLMDYVLWQRSLRADTLGDARFLCSTGLGVGNALWQVSESSSHPLYEGAAITLEDAVAKIGASTVILMLGVNDIPNYTLEAYIQNLKVLVFLIREQSPNVNIVFQSILPRIAEGTQELSNQRIFEFNLALDRFCLQYGFEYLDVASAMRDENGDLPFDLCSDPTTMGIHINDAGCQIWVDYLLTHAPASLKVTP